SQREKEHDFLLVDEWSRKHAQATYAGAYTVSVNGGLLRLGYTSHQDAWLRKAARLPGLCAPKRLRGFPHVPSHTLLRLEALNRSIFDSVDKYHGNLILNTEISIEENLVVVRTRQVRKTKALLVERYGQKAPIRIKYLGGPPPI